MLRRKGLAVDLVREERVALEQHRDRKAPLVRLLLPAVDAAIEAGEERLHGALSNACLLQHRGGGHPAPAGRSHGFEEPGLADDVRLDVHPSVACALHRHGDLDRRTSANLLERERHRALDEATDLEPPRGGVDLRDVEVGQEIVQADRRDVPTEGLERQRVVARR